VFLRNGMPENAKWAWSRRFSGNGTVGVFIAAPAA
jgi:hypothetical protein